MTDPHILLDICGPTLRTNATAGVCSSPDEVRNHPAMSTAQKRALLASWASDANAVPGVPSLRKIDDGAVVALDEILHALKALDTREEQSRRTAFWQASFDRRQARSKRPPLRRRSRDDDDDPPPSPVYAALRPKGGGGPAAASIEPMLA